MEAFETPAVVHEVGGEPVEEFGVGGRVAETAEVAGGGGEALTEVLLPNAVDEDAGGQGVLAGGDPAGEGGAAAGAVREGSDFGGCGGEDDGEAWGDGAVAFASGDEGGRGVRSEVAGDHGGRERGWFEVIEGGEVLAECVEFFFVSAFDAGVEVVPFVGDLTPCEGSDGAFFGGAIGFWFGEDGLDFGREFADGVAAGGVAIGLFGEADELAETGGGFFPCLLAGLPCREGVG